MPNDLNLGARERRNKRTRFSVGGHFSLIFGLPSFMLSLSYFERRRGHQQKAHLPYRLFLSNMYFFLSHECLDAVYVSDRGQKKGKQQETR